LNTIPDALILAAGFSSRMNHFKPLLQYNNNTFVESIILKLLKHVNNIIIVTGYNSDELTTFLENRFSKNLKKIKLIFNQEYKKGMLGSMQVGISQINKNTRWILYHFVDQPHLPNSFYSEFIKQIDDAYHWIQPEYQDKRGHPILLKQDIFEAILEIPENKDLKSLKHIKKKFWNCRYKQILQDFDYYDEYRAFLSHNIH
jgi:CTP:molybdopterin cytidylyltransferase MocA